MLRLYDKTRSSVNGSLHGILYSQGPIVTFLSWVNFAFPLLFSVLPRMPGMFETLSLQQHSTIKIVFEKPGKAGFDRKIKREVLWYFNLNQETWVNSDLLWPTKMVWDKLSLVVDYMATALTFGSQNEVAAVWFLFPWSILASILWTVNKLVFTNLLIQVFFETTCSC